MNISYNWLKKYINTSLSAYDIAEKLQISTCEVEGITSISENFSGVLIGKVSSVIPHPKADRLRIATVKIGDQIKTIVCGAPNLYPDQTVAVALPGCTLHPTKGDPFTIEETVIRGEKSEGMLCAADELGLAIPCEGILDLDSSLVSGQQLSSALDLDDTILKLEITPNRPDLLSYAGIARELSTLEKKSLLEIPIFKTEEESTKINHDLTVQINDQKLCSRYSSLIIENIRVTQSPLWMQIKLALSGITPINTIVDITNYVMLELGQPLHAYDLTSIAPDKNGTLSVRQARTSEQIVLIDSSTRLLTDNDIVITDTRDNPIALAGIMGGKISEVTPNTTSILIESATFSGPIIRKTSRRLGLRSEASSRFEKDLDSEITVSALKRALYLIQQISSGNPVTPLIDVCQKNRTERPRIHVNFSKIQQILGVNISPAEAKTILQHLGFQIPSLTKSSFEAIPPSWRKDITIPEDIIEELVRIWGFDRLPTTLPSGAIKAPKPNTVFKSKMALRRLCASLGLHETIHLSLTSESSLKKLAIEPSSCISLENPLSAETKYLIPNHLIHFLESCAGQNIRQTEFGLFEIGSVFSAPKIETLTFSCILRSEKFPEIHYRNIKLIVSEMLLALEKDVSSLSFTTSKATDLLYEKNSGLTIRVGQTLIGSCGLVSQAHVRTFKIRSGKIILSLNLNLEALFDLPTIDPCYEPLSQFPNIERDISLVVEQSVPYFEIKACIENDKSPLLQSFSVVDIYEGKNIDKNKKSVTIHFIYNHPERTLTDDEILSDQKLIFQRLETSIQATIK